MKGASRGAPFFMGAYRLSFPIPGAGLPSGEYFGLTQQKNIQLTMHA